MTLPTSINVTTALDLADGEDTNFELNVCGFNRPRPGQIWLVTPDAGAGPLRTVDHYHVQTSEPVESDEPGYDWLIELESRPVTTPRTWYEITTEIDRQGLVHLGIAVGDGTRIADGATIAAVWEQLGMD